MYRENLPKRNPNAGANPGYGQHYVNSPKNVGGANNRFEPDRIDDNFYDSIQRNYVEGKLSFYL